MTIRVTIVWFDSAAQLQITHLCFFQGLNLRARDKDRSSFAEPLTSTSTAGRRPSEVGVADAASTFPFLAKSKAKLTPKNNLQITSSSEVGRRRCWCHPNLGGASGVAWGVGGAASAHLAKTVSMWLVPKEKFASVQLGFFPLLKLP